MNGLTERDLRILGRYAKDGNRELYWNYLAHQPGNDGYALLALGVVRDDNVPGQVANRYAADYARVQQTRHGSEFPDRPRISEREWDAFGADLIREDLTRRKEQLERYRRPDLALNLPVRDVQESHDIAFDAHRIDPNAWTPRILLEAARSRDGEAAAERIWGDLLNNDLRGVVRGRDTLAHVGRYLEGSDGLRYGAALGLARLGAIPGGSNTDPDVVHRAQGVWTQRDARDGSWRDVSAGRHGVSTLQVRDPVRLAELDDTRALRLEVQQRRTQFHSDDPHRQIAASPRVLADNGRDEAPGFLVAALAPEVTDDIRDARHAGNAQYRAALDRVALFESQQGIQGGPYREQLAASLAVVGKIENIDFGRTYLAKSPDGGFVLEQRARYGSTEPDQRIPIDAATLSNLPIMQSSREWARLQSPHYVSDAPAATRSAEQMQALQRLSAGDREMFERVRAAVPAQVGDDHVLSAVQGARENGIRRAEDIGRVCMAGDQLCVGGSFTGTTRVDVTQPVPDSQATVDRLAQLEQSRELVAMQRQEQAQQTGLVRSM
ncbi:hypothetical protein E2F46_03035 [Luteimonas aestuarii]|uniref:Hemolysin n=1 Tax=Luteimonas aestuarii TaxID=453837 RepID=A0A4R5U0W7_9GAMM|nr:hypothetical protein [Luteimonas aestuarii]TDK27197.1 hypothetical protein E2F46_03035 [Luteimonas aestuarii]